MKKVTITFVIEDHELGGLIETLATARESMEVFVENVGPYLEKPPIEKVKAFRKRVHSVSRVEVEREIMEFASAHDFASRELMKTVASNQRKAYSNQLFNLVRLGKLVKVQGTKAKGYVYGLPRNTEDEHAHT